MNCIFFFHLKDIFKKAFFTFQVKVLNSEFYNYNYFLLTQHTSQESGLDQTNSN